MLQSVVPGPPFAFGAILVIMALLVAVFMPENPHGTIHVGKSKVRRRNSLTLQAFGLENGKNNKMFDCELNTFITTQQTKFWSVLNHLSVCLLFVCIHGFVNSSFTKHLCEICILFVHETVYRCTPAILIMIG